MKIPPRITAGTTVTWDDLPTTDTFGNQIDATTHTLSYYLRFNEVFEAITAVATASSLDWRTTLSSTTTSGMAAGTWYFSAVATSLSDATVLELGRGQLSVDASLVYATQAKAFDGRTQAERDLEAVQTAIRTLLNGGSVQEYRIGTRSLKRYDISELLTLEARLKAEVKREQTAQLMANGLGNPRNMFIRFN